MNTRIISFTVSILFQSTHLRTFEAPVATVQRPLQEKPVEGVAKVWNKVQDRIGLKPEEPSITILVH
jgi:hypothetical protein